jgi:hypothetical protein
MKKSYLFAALLTFTLLAGCTINKGGNTEASTASGPSPSAESASAIVEPTEEPPPEPTKEPIKELSNHEQLALDYVSIFINNSDVNDRKKFLEEKIREDVRTVFALGVGMKTSEDGKFQNPKVLDHIEYNASGLDGSLILIGSDNGIQLIAFVVEEEIGFAFKSNTKGVEAEQTFEELMREF